MHPSRSIEQGIDIIDVYTLRAGLLLALLPTVVAGITKRLERPRPKQRLVASVRRNVVTDICQCDRLTVG